MFKKDYETWMQQQIDQETNHRRKELLLKGLSHGTMELLRVIWYPTVGNFDHLYPEWEVRDMKSGYRYLDLAFMPGNSKGNVEVQDYRTHARDLDTRRFKDLCRRQSLLSLDDWIYLPIAYLSIREEPEFCKQLILSFIGKFLSYDVDTRLNWLEAETVRYARRLLRPFSPPELAKHLRISVRHARTILHNLVDGSHLVVASGNARFRTYQLNVGRFLENTSYEERVIDH